MKDYPAAHSMDTSWFAIDKCGHIAVFYSGEEGAVADGAGDSGTLFDDRPMSGELKRILEGDRTSFRIGDHAVKVTDPHRADEGKVPYAYGFFVLGKGAELWAIERKLVSPTDPPGSRRESELESTDGYLWYSGHLAVEDYKWLHEKADRCMACSHYMPIDMEIRQELYGIFNYKCPDYGHPPYDREFTPENPMTWEEIMKVVPLAQPKTVVFDKICFKDKPTIQPIEHLKSSTYGDSAWTSEDGLRHRPDGTIVTESDPDWEEHGR